MAEEGWERLQALFHEGLARSARERDAWLRELAVDRATRDELRELWAASEAEDSWLDVPLAPPATEARKAFEDFRPRIDGFELESVLGRGGMGVVWRARQLRPERVVALKLLNPGSLGPDAMARFDREARLLARLEHPGIARVYEVGVTESELGALPWFAMELVEGGALRVEADRRSLGLAARLELVAAIADAVQHAHQRGVIHRDLKPSNILLTPEGRPVILDFGIARSTEPELSTTSLATHLGQLLGTLPYMSPEQTLGDPDALDTRSDVYSLGVVAYELLVGRLPYELSRRLLPEALRVIREEEPARLRRHDTRLRGDVETILAKALEKEPARRYAAASELAADIRRHLGDEPIVARPASLAYTTTKFVRRHRGLVAAVSALLLVLIGATTVSTWLAIERNRALGRVTDAQDEAERRASIASEVRDFLERDLLGQASPFVQPDRDLAVADLVARAAERLDGRFVDEPEVEHSLRELLARTLHDLSRDAEALPQAERARELAGRLFGEASVERRHASRLVARIRAGGGAYARAVDELRALLDEERALGVGGGPDAVRTRIALGQALSMASRPAEAEAVLAEALASTEGRSRAASPAEPADDDPTAGRARGGEPTSERVDERTSDAAPAERASPDSATGGAPLDDVEFGLLRHELATARKSLGDYAGAEGLFRALASEREASLGPAHPSTLNVRHSLAILEMESGRLAEGEERARALAIDCARTLGDEHASTLSARTVHAGCLHRLGRFEEALELERAILAAQVRTRGAEHVDAAKTRGMIADALAKLGRFEPALDEALAALEVLESELGEEHVLTMLAVGRLGAIEQGLGHVDEAIEWSERALELSTRLFGPQHTQTASQVHNLGALLEAKGELARAAELFAEAARINEASFGPADPKVLTSLGSLANVHLRRGQLEPAEALYRRVIDALETAVGKDHWLRGQLLEGLGVCLERQGRRDEALTALREAARILEATFGPQHPRPTATRAFLRGLGVELEPSGDPIEVDASERGGLDG